MLRSYVVAFSSLLGGAALVHNIYKPDLTIPVTAESDEELKQMTEELMELAKRGLSESSIKAALEQRSSQVNVAAGEGKPIS
eukprot:jgi/Mesen1/4420/ME000225S03412